MLRTLRSAALPAGLCAALAALPGRGMALEAAACTFEGQPPIEVLVQPARVDPVLDRPSLVDLTARTGARGDLRLGATVGLTSATPSFTIRLGAQVMPAEGGGVCARPAVSVTVQLSPIVVSIAREVRDGSCSEVMVLNHEHEHVLAFVDGLARAGPMLRAGLLARLSGVVLRVDREEDAPGLFRSRVTEAAQAAFAQATDPIDAANARLDQEPDRFGDGPSCGDELATIILDAERARRRAAYEHARLPRRP